MNWLGFPSFPLLPWMYLEYIPGHSGGVAHLQGALALFYGKSDHVCENNRDRDHAGCPVVHPWRRMQMHYCSCEYARETLLLLFPDL
ncbi:unnamed protein product [Haemonchus placei]|uniref:Uncharacterized protein n=1 Tax=Haemonchus placei TaxID=6290 RepID=A0A3P7T9R4_HAEPC|nr:unnamed protein product [Haemonchus placei]